MTLKERKKKAKHDYLVKHPEVSACFVEAVLTESGIKINDFSFARPCLPFKGRHTISSLKPSL